MKIIIHGSGGVAALLVPFYPVIYLLIRYVLKACEAGKPNEIIDAMRLSGHRVAGICENLLAILVEHK